MPFFTTSRAAAAALTLAFTVAAAGFSNTTVIYVDASARGANDGSSWAGAFNDLQDALALAATIIDDDIQIWIAAGTYTPGTSDDGPESTFNLVSGVALYGGFTAGGGGEGSIDDRDWQTNQTIVSGFLDGSISGARSWSVLTGENLIEGTIIDGLIITGGNAWEWGDADAGGGLLLVNSALAIANCTFTDNGATRGGAIYALDSIVAVHNTLFITNTAWDAGAIRIDGGVWEIEQSQFTDQYAWEIGGAIWSTGALLNVSDTVFHTNEAETDGLGFAGAIVAQQTETKIADCLFTGNTSYGPSTIYATGDLLIQNTIFDGNGSGGYTLWGNGDLTIIDSTFTDNNASAVQWSGDDVHIAGSTFTGNNCSGSKCGVGGVQIGAASLLIEESSFDGNASPWGGNLSVGVGEGGAMIRNSRITGGSAWDSVGGLQISANSGAAIHIINTLITNNYGGVEVAGSANVNFINCTVINNPGHPLDNLIGILVKSGAAATVHNSILWGNANGDESSQIAGPASVFNSIVQGLDTHQGNGNLDADPMFLDDDGRLSPNSPAIDAGDNDAFPSHIDPIDLDGNPRFIDATGDGLAIIDIGAFEFQSKTPTIPGDLNSDGNVGVADLLILLGAWGKCDNCDDCPADLNNDCNVGVADLLILLANWTN